MKVNINTSTIYNTIVVAIVIAIYVYGIIYLFRHYEDFKIWTKSILDEVKQKHQIIKEEFINRR